MKRIHTHYDNLKVVRNAPPEVIRAAYKSLAQKYHPDLNKDNPDAARIMTLLNASYEVLSDPARRKEHDEWINSQEAETSASAATTGPSHAHRDIRHEPPKTGSYLFADLPADVKKTLSAFTSGKNQQIFAVKTGGVVWNYVWVAALGAWFYYLFAGEDEYRWGDETALSLLAVTFMVALILARNISWITRWSLSPIRCWLIVTPLYVIKTEVDRIWFWPIWTISNIKATNNYTNGVFQGTSLEMSFEAEIESFTIFPESAYKNMLSTLKKHDEAFRAAVGRGDVDYIFKNDVFAECSRESKATKRSAQESHNIYVYVATFAISIMLFTAAYSFNGERPLEPVGYGSARIRPYTPQQPAPKPVYIRPSTAPNGEPWPSNAAYVKGYKKRHINGLSSVTIDNSLNSSDVFVKLYFTGEVESYPIRVFFIPMHGKFTVNKVRAGSYDVRYQDLDSGALARSESFVLEEISTDEGVEYSNMTMTLYKVRNGNMQTYPLSEDDF